MKISADKIFANGISLKKPKAIIALFLMFAIAVSLVVALPTTNAAETGEFTTYAFIGATPNPVGVNQEVLIHFGITRELASVEMGWEDITVIVTDPDGEEETLGPFTTDSTGGSGTIFTPDKVGNYTLQTHFPEQVIPDGGGVSYFYVTIPDGTVMLESYSDELTLVVTEEAVEYYPGNPLPTEYWTRPIDSQLREWYTISGNWLYTPDNKYTTNNDDAPDTAHILWTTELDSGGLVGGDVGLEESTNQGAVGYGTGDAYEGKWSSRFIISGRLYYIDNVGSMASYYGYAAGPTQYHCVDLHTGEELWVKTFLDNQTISFGQTLYWQTGNYMGTYAYLWVSVTSYPDGYYAPSVTTWYAFDAYTGDWRFTIENVPSGTTLRDDNGALYILQYSLTDGWMAQWNMSKFCTTGVTGFSSASWGNSVNFQTFDASLDTAAGQAGLDWNVSIPTDLAGSVRATWFGNRIIGASISTTEVSVWGISLDEEDEGDVLFNTSWDAPDDWSEGNQTISWAASSEEELVGVLWSRELRQHYGISLETGKLIWGPTESQYYLDTYEGTQLTSHFIAYGNLYACGVSGILYCYDITDGDLLWTYTAEDPYTEFLWSNNWWLGIVFITDGKVYLGSSEHSANQPLPRGAPFICVNATTGEEIWRADGLFRQTTWGGAAIIGDSIIATMDTYDQRIYAIGKGPSATTVSAGPKTSVEGSSVLVEGMVTDISPGTTDSSLTMRFPNGVPAVCDDNMSDWMLYVYKQYEMPADVTGVEVVISVLDPNGNYYEVGRTTSDSSGFYKLSFVPEVPGEYTVIASFEGSGAYYGSSAETAINVEDAPAATPEPTPTPAPMTDTYVTGFGIAIIVAIAIVGILLLRRR